MRLVFVGGGPLTVMAAKLMIERRHEVVVIESDATRIDELADELDCGFIHGDGSKPAVLTECGPDSTDVLFCLTNDDQDNIIAALVGRSLGFERVVTRIDDPEYEHICIELGLHDTIVRDRAIARLLVELAEGRDPLEASGVIRAGIRFVAVAATEAQVGALDRLDLPKHTRVVLIYRGGRPLLPDAKTAIERGDELVLLTHVDDLDVIGELWPIAAKPRERERAPRT